MVDRAEPADASRFDQWEPPRDRLEALAFALFATRRTLTQTLVGLPPARVWAGADAAPGAVARGACDREFHWLWPAALEAPSLPVTPSLVELLYGLVRHRAVTEELLMTAEPAALERPHDSRIARADGRTLAEMLAHVATAELVDAERLAAARIAFEADWAGAEELLARARDAVAEAIG